MGIRTLVRLFCALALFLGLTVMVLNLTAIAAVHIAPWAAIPVVFAGMFAVAWIFEKAKGDLKDTESQ